MIAFARYCLPQVFFYGMFVLVGQVLNARGRFGPMMWAPIANNVISVAVLGDLPRSSVRRPRRRGDPEPCGGVRPYTAARSCCSGSARRSASWCSCWSCCPYLRRAGFRFRPRFDFRGTGLGHTLRLGIWTVLFVIVNQIAYTVVVRIASCGTADAVDGVRTGQRAAPATRSTPTRSCW